MWNFISPRLSFNESHLLFTYYIEQSNRNCLSKNYIYLQNSQNIIVWHKWITLHFEIIQQILQVLTTTQGTSPCRWETAQAGKGNANSSQKMQPLILQEAFESWTTTSCGKQSSLNKCSKHLSLHLFRCIHSCCKILLFGDTFINDLRLLRPFGALLIQFLLCESIHIFLLSSFLYIRNFFF